MPPQRPKPEVPPSPKPNVDPHQQLLELGEAVEAAEQQRSFFQLERDQVQRLWDIAREELEGLQIEALLKDNEMEEAEERHQVELMIYQQKLRHVAYEHRLEVQQRKEALTRAQTEASTEHHTKVGGLLKGKAALDQELQAAAGEHAAAVATRRQAHQRLRSMRQAEFERALREVEDKAKTRMRLLEDDLELRRRVEIHEVEERKNEHLQALITRHEAVFAEMKVYYNDITTKNLEIIRALKEELANMKETEQANEKLMAEITQENKRLTDPLQQALGEVDALKREVATYEKDRQALQGARVRLKALGAQLRALQAGHDTLREAFATATAERDALLAGYEGTARAVQRRSGARGLKAQPPPEAGDGVAKAAYPTASLPPLRGMSTTVAADPHAEIGRLEAQHHAMVAAYEAKCKEAGLPPLDLTALGLASSSLSTGLLPPL